ncbi:hypothetical protein ET445_06630 [Agromyces protaetiae]|uniref:Uncharacterized protein n=1 Tax=Agromyces protaetiae TaxID=2509455 RepID=A0A4P6FDK1_9MICO|nr:hypothetical protein [Agromyces protaetiae]QAY73073.1 hypothetical protein ET445_06630 [Agromyces protaetiae]
MTDEEIAARTPDDGLSEEATELQTRCIDAGLDVTFRRRYEGEPYEEFLAIIEFPAGRGTRAVGVEERYFPALLAHAFEKVRFLDEYAAFIDAAGTIEAAIPPTRASVVRLSSLPGVIREDGEPTSDEEELLFGRRDAPWHLEIPDPSSTVVLAFGTPSDLGQALLPARETLQIRGVPSASHDESLEALEKYANRLAFDLDVVFGARFRIPRRRRLRREAREVSAHDSVAFPRNDYALEPLRLYHYGREADGLPLLEFLAYYQAVEYFFPFFAREQTMNDVRSTLKHPRFNPNDDKQVGKLISLAAQGRGQQSEREQLRTTIRSCVGEADLREYVEADQDRLEALTAKKQSIRGVKSVRFENGADDIRDQLADRIYAIRCRIVHSKQDGGGYDEVLLPGTREADALSADINVLQFVAQRVLIARAARA